MAEKTNRVPPQMSPRQRPSEFNWRENRNAHDSQRMKWYGRLNPRTEALVFFELRCSEVFVP